MQFSKFFSQEYPEKVSSLPVSCHMLLKVGSVLVVAQTVNPLCIDNWRPGSHAASQICTLIGPDVMIKDGPSYYGSHLR